MGCCLPCLNPGINPFWGPLPSLGVLLSPQVLTCLRLGEGPGWICSPSSSRSWHLGLHFLIFKPQHLRFQGLKNSALKWLLLPWVSNVCFETETRMFSFSLPSAPRGQAPRRLAAAFRVRVGGWEEGRQGWPEIVIKEAPGPVFQNMPPLCHSIR